MVPGLTVEMAAFFEIQLPATLLLGLAFGVFAVHIILVRRGRMSPRANSVLVLIAAFEAAAIAQNPAAWDFLLGFFFLVASSMALVDLAVIIWLDSRRPAPRFSPRARRLALSMTPTGLILIGFVLSAILKYDVIALNPQAVFLLEPTMWFVALLTPFAPIMWFVALLAPFALLDLAFRVILGKVIPNRLTL